MTKHVWIGAVCVALASAMTGRGEAGQAAAPSKAAVTAAKASPDLVGQLSTELGSSPEQAAGAAGALFGLAKSRLQPDEFKQVSNSVPGMDALLLAAPAAGAKAKGTSGNLSQLAGQAGGLMAAASAFSKLGLSPDLVAKAVPILTSFVGKSGGANVASLLSGVLK
jgi:Protein of unknown function VcgC/VcgE (DUF2780)